MSLFSLLCLNITRHRLVLVVDVNIVACTDINTLIFTLNTYQITVYIKTYPGAATASSSPSSPNMQDHEGTAVEVRRLLTAHKRRHHHFSLTTYTQHIVPTRMDRVHDLVRAFKASAPLQHATRGLVATFTGGVKIVHCTTRIVFLILAFLRLPVAAFLAGLLSVSVISLGISTLW